MITILDYGMGNISSIQNMLHRIGAQTTISFQEKDILNARALLLPGVGAFDNAMQKLQSSGLLPLLQKRVLMDKVPFLGICLGMQLLFRSSEEGKLPGLDFIPGIVQHFNFAQKQKETKKIPHMGWNLVQYREGNLLFKNFETLPRFYFVHSYHAVCDDEKHIAATTDYGYAFTCAVQKENIFGVQFHPEKSHKFGMQLFRNFLEIVC